MGTGRVKVRYVCLTHLGMARGDGCPHSRWAAPWHAPWGGWGGEDSLTLIQVLSVS